MFDFVFEVANDEQRRELDAAIDLISWGLEFETGCKAQSWKQIKKYRISAVGKTQKKHSVGKTPIHIQWEKNTNTQLVGKTQIHNWWKKTQIHKVCCHEFEAARNTNWMALFFHNGT